MFLLSNNEIIYLASGSYDKFMNFFGQYAIQWNMIKYACDNKYLRYNFYGIMDVFNKKGKDYGVYKFKKGFNGQVEETLGEYYYITNKNIYKLHNLLSKFKSMLKKN